jgi:hypothetical protein
MNSCGYSSQVPELSPFPFPSSSSDQEHDILLALFIQHRHRIQELHLGKPPSAWMNLLSVPDDHLVCLSIKEPPKQLKEPLLLNVSCSHLALRETTRRINLRWEFITVLCLVELREDVCVELLKQCVNLVEYRNNAPISTTFNTPMPTSPFTLPYLKTFEWSVCYESLARLCHASKRPHTSPGDTCADRRN